MKNLLKSYSLGALSLKSRSSLAFLATALLLGHSAQAAQDTWSSTAGSTAWATGSNWIGGNAPANDLVTDTAFFNSATYAHQPNTGTRSVAGVEVGGSSGALTISGTAFSLGATGFLIDSGASTVTLSAPTSLGASQSWTNNSASLFTASGAISGASAANLTLNAGSTGGMTLSGAVNSMGSITNSGAGTGTTTISGVIGSNVTGVTENSAGSELVLSNANTYTGGLTIDAGTVLLKNSAAASPAANPITLGNSTAASASLLSTTNISNAINLTSGNTGTLTVGSDATATGQVTYSGNIALNGDNLTFAVNGTNSLTQSGIISGTGNVNITGTNSFLLQGANTFTGAVNLVTGDLVLRNAAALGNTGNALNIGAGTILDSGTNPLTLTNAPVVTVLGNFTYGSTYSLSTGAGSTLVLPTGSTTITIGTSTGTVGRVLTFGSTSLAGTLTVQSNLANVGSTAISGLSLGTVSTSSTVTLTGNEIFNVDNSAAGDLIELTLGTTTDNGMGYSITKNGSGILYLNSTTNSLSGPITVNGGVLGVSGNVNPNASLGSATITLENGTALGRLDGGGSSGSLSNAVNIASGATVSLFDGGAHLFGLSGPVTIGGGATIIEQNPNSTTPAVAANGFTISGATTLGGNVTLDAAQNFLNFTGAISDAASTSGDGIVINTANTSGATAATTVTTLNNAKSTFDGGVTLNSGSLALGGGSTLSGTAVTQGAAGTGTLTLNGGSIGFVTASVAGTTTSYINNSTVIDGNVEFGGSTTNGLADNAMIFGGAITIDGGSVLTSPTGTTANSTSFNSSVIPLSTVTLAGNITVKPSSGSTFIFDDAIGESVAGSGITIGDGTTTGTVIFGTNTGNPNTYTGATTVLSGLLQLEATEALQESTLVLNSTAGGVVFDQSVASHAFTFGGLSGNGNLALQDNASTPNPVALSVGNNNSSTTYSGILSGGGSLNKIGTGTLALSNANTYAGGTTVSAGNLAVNNTSGSGTGSGAVQVNAGALGGTGTINTSLVTSGNAVDIAAGATLSPSNGVTTGFSHLSFALQTGTSFALETGSKLVFDLGATTASSDEVLITGGTLTFNGQNFSDFTFNAESTIAPGLYTLMDSTGGITGTLGTTMGSFDNGLYDGTLIQTSNDLELSVTAAPEPGVWAMLLGGLGMLIVVQRSRRQKLD